MVYALSSVSGTKVEFFGDDHQKIGGFTTSGSSLESVTIGAGDEPALSLKKLWEFNCETSEQYRDLKTEQYKRTLDQLDRMAADPKGPPSQHCVPGYEGILHNILVEDIWELHNEARRSDPGAYGDFENDEETTHYNTEETRQFLAGVLDGKIVDFAPHITVVAEKAKAPQAQMAKMFAFAAIKEVLEGFWRRNEDEEITRYNQGKKHFCDHKIEMSARYLDNAQEFMADCFPEGHPNRQKIESAVAALKQTFGRAVRDSFDRFEPGYAVLGRRLANFKKLVDYALSLNEGDEKLIDLKQYLPIASRTAAMAALCWNEYLAAPALGGGAPAAGHAPKREP